MEYDSYALSLLDFADVKKLQRWSAAYVGLNLNGDKASFDTAQ